MLFKVHWAQIPNGTCAFSFDYNQPLCTRRSFGRSLISDLPTPAKYYNPEIAKEYKKIEAAAEYKLLSILPDEFKEDFAPFLVSHSAHSEDAAIVKQADSICAYLKCLEELSAGNHEYALAKRRLEETLQQRHTPEMEYFLQTFAPSFELTLDEIN